MQFIKYENIIKEEAHCHCKLLAVCLFLSAWVTFVEQNALVSLNGSNQFSWCGFFQKKKKKNQA